MTKHDEMYTVCCSVKSSAMQFSAVHCTALNKTRTANSPQTWGPGGAHIVLFSAV